MAKETLEYLLDAQRRLGELKECVKEDNFAGAKEKRTKIEGSLEDYLGDGHEKQQGTLLKEIKDKVLDMPLFRSLDWRIKQKASLAEQAFAFCLALGDVLDSEDEKRGARCENCVACLNWALRGAIDAQEEMGEIWSALPPSEGARTHNAFNPNMVFGRAKYPRAV